MSFLPYIIVIVFGLLLLKNRVWAFSFYLSCRLLLPPIVRMGTISMNSVMSFMMVAYLLLNIKSLINKESKLLFPRIQQASAKVRNVFVKALLWC